MKQSSKTSEIDIFHKDQTYCENFNYFAFKKTDDLFHHLDDHTTRVTYLADCLVSRYNAQRELPYTNQAGFIMPRDSRIDSMRILCTRLDKVWKDVLLSIGAEFYMDDPALLILLGYADMVHLSVINSFTACLMIKRDVRTNGHPTKYALVERHFKRFHKNTIFDITEIDYKSMRKRKVPKIISNVSFHPRKLCCESITVTDASYGNTWTQRLVGVHIVVIRNDTGSSGELLVIRERVGKKYNLPGGKPEPGETLGEALMRELTEEGVKIQDRVYQRRGFLMVSESSISSYLMHLHPDNIAELNVEHKWLPFEYRTVDTDGYVRLGLRCAREFSMEREDDVASWVYQKFEAAMRCYSPKLTVNCVTHNSTVGFGYYYDSGLLLMRKLVKRIEDNFPNIPWFDNREFSSEFEDWVRNNILNDFPNRLIKDDFIGSCNWVSPYLKKLKWLYVMCARSNLRATAELAKSQDFSRFDQKYTN